MDLIISETKQTMGQEAARNVAQGLRERLSEHGSANLIVATGASQFEMLEHLVDPHGFVRRIADHSRFLVASSPWTETKEAHYEFHTWAWDVAGYAELLESNGWSILSHISVSWFQVVLAERL